MISVLSCHMLERELHQRIADAKQIQTTLYYKTERTMPFSKFLDLLQRFFTILKRRMSP